MTINLDTLEAKARAATPGPWRLWGSDAVTIEASTFIATTSDTRPMPQQQADAAFIAAASPDAVLALVERVRKAEALLRRAAKLDDNEQDPMLRTHLAAYFTQAPEGAKEST